MDFVNRTSEIEALEELLAAEGPVLVRVYGRRRLGKTELLRRVCDRLGGLYLLVDDADRRQVLDSLSRQWAAETGSLAMPMRDWDAFWAHVADASPPFVVLDEFQRLISNDKQAVTRLQDRWDRELSREGPSIVLCGSSVGMMQRLTEGRSGPLFGRLHGDLRVRPFSYGAVRLLYPDVDEAERVRRFAVFGGTPHYHQWSVGRDLETAVRRSFLSVTAPFKEEPQTLLQFELKSPTRYNSILYEIGQGSHQLADLETKVGVQKGGLGPYLDVLRNDLDLVRMTDPICGRKRQARYEFADPFFAFYFRFVFRNRPRLELGRDNDVWTDIEAQLDAHVGHQFEQIIREALCLVNGTEFAGVPVDFERIGRWWNRTGEELDVVAEGPDEVIAGEVKWSRAPQGPGLVAQVLRKADLIEDLHGRPVRPLVAARAGLTKAGADAAERARAVVMDLDTIEHLFEEHYAGAPAMDAGARR